MSYKEKAAKEAPPKKRTKVVRGESNSLIPVGKNKKQLHWRVNGPEFLREIFENLSVSKTHGVLQKPMQIFLGLIAEISDYAIKLNDPGLNARMIRMTWYQSAHPQDPNFDATDAYLEQVEAGDMPTAQLRDAPDENGLWWRKDKEDGSIDCVKVRILDADPDEECDRIISVNGVITQESLKLFDWVRAWTPWDGLAAKKRGVGPH